MVSSRISHTVSCTFIVVFLMFSLNSALGSDNTGKSFFSLSNFACGAIGRTLPVPHRDLSSPPSPPYTPNNSPIPSSPALDIPDQGAVSQKQESAKQQDSRSPIAFYQQEHRKYLADNQAKKLWDMMKQYMPSTYNLHTLEPWSTTVGNTTVHCSLFYHVIKAADGLGLGFMLQHNVLDLVDLSKVCYIDSIGRQLSVLQVCDDMVKRYRSATKVRVLAHMAIAHHCLRQGVNIPTDCTALQNLASTQPNLQLAATVVTLSQVSQNLEQRRYR